MKLNLTFVGDIFPANLKYHTGFGVASQFEKNNGKLWLNNLDKYFNKADLSFSNLESPLINKEKNPENKIFAGSEYFAIFLRELGIDVVSIANNHILEQGIDGLYSTKKILKKNNIKYVGDFFNNTSNVEIFDVKGVKIGIAGFCNINDNQKKFKDKYALYSDQSVIKALNIMSSFNVDYKIMSFHWGDEYINIPSRKQIEDAHKFIDLGVDIIIGHHPHVIQPVEKYKKGLIFYSLGNFIFDMVWSKSVRLGMVAHITLEKGKEVKYSCDPIYIGDDYVPRRINNFNSHQTLVNRIEKKNKKFTSYLENNLSDLDYDSFYKKKARMNNLYHRIMMKLFILKNWAKVTKGSKKLLISNILFKLKLI